MLEALSHIQASVVASSGEGHAASYRTFREALYERFDHISEHEHSTFDGLSIGARMPDGKREAGPESPEAKDKFQKLWPAIARKE